LGICKLVKTTGCPDGEITPHISATSEIQLLEGTRRWLESLIRILGSDPDSDNMSLGHGFTLCIGRLWQLEVEINLGVPVGVGTIKSSDIANLMKGDSHGDLKLSGREIDAGYHLSCGMLNLTGSFESMLVKKDKIEIL
jgi:hypothetical protein